MEPDWTCPFCSLLCDGFALERGAQALVLHGTDCPRAQAGLAALAVQYRHSREGGNPATASAPGAASGALGPRLRGDDEASAEPWIDGVAAAAEEALAAAARRLGRWQQPLFGGLGLDTAGARALLRLAARTGAICDHADGEAQMHGLRALQDRGQGTTTLAEIRARADLVLCVGTQALAHYPEFFRRCGFERPDTPCRRLVFLGVEPPPGLPAQLAIESIAGCADVFADLQQLAALVTGAACREPDPQLASLAATLREARYAVLVWEAALLPPQGALAVEALNRIVAALNRTTRAATFALGGSDGASTVQQVFTWSSGLPLRTRFGAEGPEHEPLRFAGQRLLDDHAVDGLLWTWTFGPGRLPPATGLPSIVLGPPAMGPLLREQGGARQCVFLPVATPGLNAAGHLFRVDGVVVPLVAVRDDALPGAQQVLLQLLAALEAPAQAPVPAEALP